MKQVRALMEHLVPGIGFAVFQSRTLIGGPFFEKCRNAIAALEVSGKGLFKTPAKYHRRTGVFFLPTVHVAIAILPRATKVLANLCVAVDHRMLLAERQ